MIPSSHVRSSFLLEAISDYTTAGGDSAFATAGSPLGLTFVSGDACLMAALDCTHSHLWRNYGSELSLLHAPQHRNVILFLY